MTSSNDAIFMRQALELATQNMGLASPNPQVGAVIVDAGGEVIGRGSHTYDGVKHAEILALDQAGSRARGATLYLNLEPCSHVGRTGPCADALIAAGIGRVVASMADPNPAVSGQGFAKLREAGVEVEVGVLETQAKRLNEAFAKYIRTRTPFVTLKTAMTLDGKIAPPPDQRVTGDLGSLAATGGWITSADARVHVHEMRHANDSILVGVGTIIADDPLLTDRTQLPRRRPLLRAILDSRLRIPLDSRVVRTARQDVIVFCCFAEENKRQELEARGIRVEQVPMRRPPEDGTIPFPGGLPISDGRPDLDLVLSKLAELEIISLIIEGGAMVNWAALSAGIVDKIFFYYAPKILAGTGSIPFALGPGYRRMSEAAYVKSLVLHRFGEDFAVEGYLRDPYEAVPPSAPYLIQHS